MYIFAAQTFDLTQQLIIKYSSTSTAYNIALLLILLQMASQELILSACQGNLDRMASLVHSGLVYVDVVDRMGVSALFAASIHGHVELVDFLLNEGADVNRVATSQYTPLSACYHLHYKAQVGHTKVCVISKLGSKYG